MTPPDTDTELQERLRGVWHDNFNESEFIEEMEVLIKVSNEKTAREARIDELTAVRNIEGATVDAWASPAYQHILDRINELQFDTPNKEAKS